MLAQSDLRISGFVASPRWFGAALESNRSLNDVDWTRASDDLVARGCATNDHEAFAELVRRYQRPLFNSAYRLLGSYEDATDATQHALIQAYLALPQSRLGLPVRPWLFRIVRNHCIDRLRRKEAIPFSKLKPTDDEESDLPVDAADAAPLPEEVAERSDIEQVIHSAIDALTPRYRSVVRLRYQADLSFAEIGSRLGVPEPTARTLFQRAKAKLRRALADQV